MSCHSYIEKPADWNVAPQSEWVSGTPIGDHSGIKMPSLGDPAGYYSAKVSFGDDMPDVIKTYNGHPVKECPDGTGSDPKTGICTPEHSDADPIKIAQQAAKRIAREKEKTLSRAPKGQFRRPETGKELLNVGKETASVRALAKQGAKARGAKLN